jgi:putative ABC transport system permease protein
MIVTYLKLAFRNLRKNRLYSFLNITGLALGICACLLIALYVRDELSYDRFHEKADRIFRINADIKFGGKETFYAVAPDPMAFTMKKEYAEVEEACRLREAGHLEVRKGREVIEEKRVVYADSTFFQVFSFPLLEGDSKSALTEPNTMVVSETIARKYFGAANGITGRSLQMKDGSNWRITGVMRDMPAAAHMHFDFIRSMISWEEAGRGMWGSHNFQSYLLLRPGVRPEAVESRFDEIIRRYTVPQIEALFGAHYDEMLAQGNYLKYTLMNVRDIHLYGNNAVELEANSDVRYVWIFSLVALFVLLIACINFMNLSTAQASGRAREVGMRKVLGSARAALIGQFLSESAVLTAISFTLAILAVILLLPAFNSFTGKQITLWGTDWDKAPGLIWPLLLLGAITALVAGSYPAFYLSAFRPIEVLKGKISSAVKTGWLRSGLVVFQFCTSIVLIISVVVIQKQLAFVQTTKLGFDKERLLIVRNTGSLNTQTSALKAELNRIAGVESVTCSDYYPVPSSRSEESLLPEGQTDMNHALSSQLWRGDFDYLKTLGMEVKSGRNFDPAMKTDSTAVLVNEEFCKASNWTDPIGKKLTSYVDAQGLHTVVFHIIGVVSNFHFESLRERISPLVLGFTGQSNAMGIRLSPSADLPQTMKAIESKFQLFLPAQSFNYSFLNEDFDNMYRSEQRIGRILGSFAGFAVFIACLGLFGLAAYTTERRTKEIGIRKVLGATVTGITQLLAKDFLWLVLISILLATPIAWYAMHKWLEDFAYRTALSWWVFGIAGGAALAIALLTVSYQSIRAAMSDPVKSLRSE